METNTMIGFVTGIVLVGGLIIFGLYVCRKDPVGKEDDE